MATVIPIWPSQNGSATVSVLLANARRLRGGSPSRWEKRLSGITVGRFNLDEHLELAVAMRKTARYQSSLVMARADSAGHISDGRRVALECRARLDGMAAAELAVTNSIEQHLGVGCRVSDHRHFSRSA